MMLHGVVGVLDQREPVALHGQHGTIKIFPLTYIVQMQCLQRPQSEVFRGPTLPALLQRVSRMYGIFLVAVSPLVSP
jgi:hypothetical protein